MEKKIINFGTYFDDLTDEVRTGYASTEQKQSKPERFAQIAQSMVNIYESKNADYGDSFSDSVKEFGYIAGIVRMSDKFNRLKTLLAHNKEAYIKTESVKDTLIDLASYSVMLLMELEENEI